MPREKILAKYSFPPKNPGIENFKPPKNPSIIPVTSNPEYLPPALGPGPLSFKYVKWRWKQLRQIKTENVNPRWAHGKHNSGLFSSMKDHLTSKDRYKEEKLKMKTPKENKK